MPKLLKHVAIDMTPLLPGGQNGGAGLVAISLAKNLPRLAPDVRWTLLTSSGTHADLATLDAANVQRLCMTAPSGQSKQLRSWGRQVLRGLLPPVAAVRLGELIRQRRSRRELVPRVAALQPDLLFCPFTIPYFWHSGTPLVSTVHDLQELTYPQFFTPEQRLFRQRHLRDAGARAARLVCVSDYVRGTLLSSVAVQPAQVRTIPLALLNDLHDSSTDARVLESLGLRANQFLLYPANFWAHKNHRRLFEAFLLHRGRHPQSHVTLVCTGAPNCAMRTLESEAPAGVAFTGYVSSADMGSLLRSCAAVIFPSLYEGFGLPVLEAMAFGKPVLCSNVTSLPEVVGDAGIYFDPTEPDQIAAAIARLEESPADVAELVTRGRERAASFGTGRDMAAQYLGLFNEVLAECAT
jgi:glycosyltransferase involved in cell wall biosynthesis